MSHPSTVNQPVVMLSILDPATRWTPSRSVCHCAPVIDASPIGILRGIEGLSLPKTAWTHEAHLLACWATLDERSAEDALAHLRSTIRRYNEATGTANTETSGYHETLTVYFVYTIDHLRQESVSLDEMLVHPSCGRRGPLAHWTSELFMAAGARAAWTLPDLAPLPWEPVPFSRTM